MHEQDGFNVAVKFSQSILLSMACIVIQKIFLYNFFLLTHSVMNIFIFYDPQSDDTPTASQNLMEANDTGLYFSLHLALVGADTDILDKLNICHI